MAELVFPQCSLGDFGCFSAEGEPADSDPLGLEGNDAAFVEVFCHGGEVREQRR